MQNYVGKRPYTLGHECDTIVGVGSVLSNSMPVLENGPCIVSFRLDEKGDAKHTMEV